VPCNHAVASADETELNGEDNEDVACLDVRPVADLVLTKTAAAASLPLAGEVAYTITVRNTGPSTATGVVVTDLLPFGLLVDASEGVATTRGGCEVEADVHKIVCSTGALDVGDEMTITIVGRARVVAPALPGLCNRAVTNAFEVDPEPADNGHVVRRHPGLRIRRRVPVPVRPTLEGRLRHE
jgi:uncharacterized repeat protein (TIGR01451 family)